MKYLLHRVKDESNMLLIVKHKEGILEWSHIA